MEIPYLSDEKIKKIASDFRTKFSGNSIPVEMEDIIDATSLDRPIREYSTILGRISHFDAKRLMVKWIPECKHCGR